ncbi:hypothetical protein AX758_11435 [Enterococcus mundtii]|uniref:hypothetical protein n=1 Tax=Enterococcus mundtii TaxID=53346 RepID=UPI0007EEF0FE|nr:hypothetical protein [Enterococcus mundtii]OBS62306.1 hypothetical protein AX758_11435 [Enterococcus mundtii]
MRDENGRKAYLGAAIDLYGHSIVSCELGYSDNHLLVMNMIKKQWIRTLVYGHYLIVIADFNTSLMTIRNLKQNKRGEIS